MRIVIDMQGTQTESRFRGIGRYTMSLAKAMVRNKGEHEIILALNGLFPETIESIRAEFDGLLPQENIRVWYAPGPVKEEQPGNKPRRQVAEYIREAFLASLQPDLVHICSLFEGYVDDAVTSIARFDKQIPVSVSLYDLIPLLNPEHCLTSNQRYSRYYNDKVDYLKQSSCFLAISESARQEGLKLLNLPESRVVNVLTAIDPCFQPIETDDGTAENLYKKLSISRPFVLNTVGADKRKNLSRLIKAYSALPDSLRQTHQLVFAGKMPEGDISQLKKSSQKAGLSSAELCFTDYVNDNELIHLYNLCKLFVFPSWHEGFVLHALEAMACGAPVIGANTTSLPEVIGLSEALFDPFNVQSICSKMAQALNDDNFRAKLREHGLEQAKKFSWEITAQKSIQAWESTLTDQSKRNIVRPIADNKPRLAFVSPLPPERTGIADYSAELLPALAEHYEIELIVAQDVVDMACIEKIGNVRDVEWLKQNRLKIDRVVYQVGNSPFHEHMLDLMHDIQGVVVLHDFFLSSLMEWREFISGHNHVWSQELYRSHCYKGVAERYEDAELAKIHYPVNWSVLQNALGIIVHSNYSRKLFFEWYGKNNTIRVIPLLRQPPANLKRDARIALGFNADDFIVCSFGFLGSTKCSHELLNAWLRSSLSANPTCHLVFVGQNHSDDYGVRLLKIINRSGCNDRIQITGYVPMEKFREYLSIADISVQLRTNSRGETSGTVLDCMNHAVPIIVNANGSMAELDPEAVWMLPDDFKEEDLIDAIETLWKQPEMRLQLGRNAQKIIHELHAPKKCAAEYFKAIEDFYQSTASSFAQLVNDIGSITPQPAHNEIDLTELAGKLALSFPESHPAKRLFLDITATCSNDLKTGIERVARAITLTLLKLPPHGYRIEPVYLSNTGGKWHYRFARQYTLGLLNCPQGMLSDDVVDPQNGDVIFGLDISGDKLTQAEKAGLFEEYRNHGVPVQFMLHDLLPIRMPDCFPPGSDKNHAEWLRSVLTFDGAICVTKTVANDLAIWREELGINLEKRRPYRIAWSHHGADFACSAPSKGLQKNAVKVLKLITSCPSFLMVGTIEPRKGYLKALHAFDLLWRKGIKINLVIVGREGWQGVPNESRHDIPETIQYLQNHPELRKRLFWLEGISDEYLEKVYASSTCLIAASYGEGFGLPLIEAAQHKLPIIARDIPVFREVAGEHAFYFEGNEPHQLADSIKEWISLYEKDRHPESDKMPWLTWEESAKKLSQILTSKDTINER